MKAKYLIGLLALLSLTACEKPQPTVEPVPPSMFTLRINTVSEDATHRLLPIRTDVFLYPITTEIEFDTIVLGDRTNLQPYSLQHIAIPQDTVRVSRQQKQHEMVVECGQYKAVEKYIVLYWEDDTAVYRYIVHPLTITSDTTINDTLLQSDYNRWYNPIKR